MPTVTGSRIPMRFPTGYIEGDTIFATVTEVTGIVSDTIDALVTEGFVHLVEYRGDTLVSVETIAVEFAFSIDLIHNGYTADIEYLITDQSTGDILLHIDDVQMRHDRFSSLLSSQNDDIFYDRLLLGSTNYVGSERSDFIDGINGNDRIDGAGGDDYLIGHTAAGDMTLAGGAGVDTFEIVVHTNSIIFYGFEEGFFEDYGDTSWEYTGKPTVIEDFSHDTEIILVTGQMPNFRRILAYENSDYDPRYDPTLDTDIDGIRWDFSAFNSVLLEPSIEIALQAIDLDPHSVLPDAQNYRNYYDMLAPNETTASGFALLGQDFDDQASAKDNLRILGDIIDSLTSAIQDGSNPLNTTNLALFLSGQTGVYNDGSGDVLIQLQTSTENSNWGIGGISVAFSDGSTIVLAAPSQLSNFYGIQELSPYGSGIGAIISKANETAIEFRNDGGDAVVTYDFDHTNGTKFRPDVIRLKGVNAENLEIGRNILFEPQNLDGPWPGESVIDDHGTFLGRSVPFLNLLSPTYIDPVDLGAPIWSLDSQGSIDVLSGSQVTGATDLVQHFTDFLDEGPLSAPVIDNLDNVNGVHLNRYGNYALGSNSEDQIRFGSGGVIVRSFDGDDTISISNTGSQPNIVEAGAGDDLISASGFLFGGDGDDTINFATFSGSISLRGSDFLKSDPSGNVGYGGAGNDKIQGNAAAILYGENGDDILIGSTRMAAQDILVGGAGADSLKGNRGDDLYIVEDTLDTITENAGASYGFDTLAAPFQMALPANVEAFRLIGEAAVDLEGTFSTDYFTGNDASNSINGYDGDDILNGAGGEDTLIGGSGDDQLAGGPGDDILIGGSGSDQLTGGLDDDIYMLTDAFDTIIEDVNSGYDIIKTTVDTSISFNIEEMHLLNTAGGTLRGSLGDESLRGDSGDDVLIGLAGADKLNGGDGDDALSGGDGDDALTGGLGSDTLRGGFGDDIYILDDAFDRVIEGVDQGWDIIYAAFAIALPANVEEFRLVGTNAVNIDGGAGADSLWGNDARNVINGLDGRDALYGLGGDDVLSGGADADRLEGGLGNDTYILDDALDQVIESAGAGWDTIMAAFAVALPDNVEVFRLIGDAAADLEGRAIADSLWGNDAANVINGLGGRDRLYGLGGDDTLLGDLGADRLEGGDGDDDLIGGDDADLLLGEDGADSLSGDAGDDAIAGGAGDDVIRGGDGDDNVFAGDGDDAVFGESGDDVLRGEAGADAIEGGDGDDRIAGGAGADLLTGGAGADLLWGGDGGDTYIVEDIADGIWESGRADGVDVVKVRVDGYRAPYNIERVELDMATGATLIGRQYSDFLFGNVGNDVLKGGAGHDTLSGGAGNDLLLGHDGYDVMNGEGGDDVLYGAAGRDHYTGGAGSDRFVLGAGTGLDRIWDFTGGEDVLDIRGFNLPDFAAFIALARTNSAGNTVADFGGGDMAILYGVNSAGIAQSDVLI